MKARPYSQLKGAQTLATRDGERYKHRRHKAEFSMLPTNFSDIFKNFREHISQLKMTYYYNIYYLPFLKLLLF